MATYDEAESSAAGSRPVELITFAIGFTNYRYCTGPLAVTVNGNEYEPQATSRSSVVLGATAHDQTVQVDLPANNPFAKLYVDVVPSETATCTILRVQRGESPAFATTAVVFKGRVKAVKFSGDGLKASIGVQSLEASLNKNMLAYTFQGPCNHQLYSAGCGSDPALHTYTGVVTAVTGSQITVAGLDASGLDFLGGYCHPTGNTDFRLVLSQLGDNLSLLIPFAHSPLGQEVAVFEGCDHLPESGCAVKHDRVVAYGGWAWVPKRNPFASGI